MVMNAPPTTNMVSAQNTVLKNIELRPGIRKDWSAYMAEGGFVDCDRIRFRDGRAESIGGWVRETVVQAANPVNELFTSTARAVLAWVALDQKQFLAVAGNKKIELMMDGEIYDISPIDTTYISTNGLATTFGLSIVTLTIVAHNRAPGDFIYVASQNVAIGGITLFGSYEILTTPDANHVTIDAVTVATGTFPAGTPVVVTIDIPVANGDADNTAITGWSGGTWNTPGPANQGWNRPRIGIGDTDLRQQSLATWGEDLIACIDQGGIYQWDRTNDVTTRLQPILNAPTINHMILVAIPARFLIAFGSQTFAPPNDFDPLIIRWAAEQTLTSWDINSLSTAGEYRIPTGNKIVTAVQTRSEILVFTDVDVYSMRFVGGTDIFQFTPLGTNISCTSVHSPVDVNGVVYWMGIDAFYKYDGAVHIVPCTLDRFIFHDDGEGRFNFRQKEKIFGGINKEFNEVIWFYPRFDETECGHYIKYNFFEDVWDFGTMDRTVWTDKGIFSRPYAVAANGRLYAQEVGLNDDAAPLNAYITTAYFDIDDGENLMFVNRIVPDVTLSSGNGIQITVYAKKYPHPGAQVVTKGPYNFDDSDRKISFRAKGRHQALKFACVATNSDFSLGKIRVSSEIDGGR